MSYQILSCQFEELLQHQVIQRLMAMINNPMFIIYVISFPLKLKLQLGIPNIIQCVGGNKGWASVSWWGLPRVHHPPAPAPAPLRSTRSPASTSASASETAVLSVKQPHWWEWRISPWIRAGQGKRAQAENPHGDRLHCKVPTHWFCLSLPINLSFLSCVSFNHDEASQQHRSAPKHQLFSFYIPWSFHHVRTTVHASIVPQCRSRIQYASSPPCH